MAKKKTPTKTVAKKTTTKKVTPKAEKPVVKKKEKTTKAGKAKITPVKKAPIKQKSEPIKEHDFDLLRGDEKEVFIKRVKEATGVNNVEKYMDDFRKSKESIEFKNELPVNESSVFIQTNLIGFIQKQLTK